MSPYPQPPNAYRLVRPAVSWLIYALAFIVPVVLALAVIGSTPSLLEKVPEQHRGTVAAVAEVATRLNGADGGLLPSADAGPANSIIPNVPVAMPRHGEWSPRRPEDYTPPAGLIAGVDYSFQVEEDGYIAHWPCGHEIPVYSFDAPPGGEADLAWAVETLAFSSGLPLRYLGPGAESDRAAEGAISVTYGDHPDFHGTDIAGVGGPTVWPRGLVMQGAVTLRPESVNPAAGDPWNRSLTLHELMHAVGITHAVPYGPEIMAERPTNPPQMLLGYGDRFALHVVGCPGTPTG